MARRPSGQEVKRPALPRPHGLKMPVIESQDITRAVAVGKNHQRRVRQPEIQITVAIVHAQTVTERFGIQVWMFETRPDHVFEHVS